MNKQRIQKTISIILIISLLLGMNGSGSRVCASSYKEEDNAISITENMESEQVSGEKSSEESDTESTTDNYGDDVEEEDDDTSLTTAEENSALKSGSTTEKENWDFDAPESMYEESINVRMASASSDDDFHTEEGAVSLPTDSLPADTTKLYEISTYEQWKALAKYSQNSSLSEYRFCYISRDGTNKTYDFTEVDFTGIGNKEYPFEGELFANYDIGTLTLEMKTPLFSYLSSKAVIRNIQIVANGTCAGLAENLVADASDFEAKFSYIKVSDASTNSVENNVYNKSGCAGGLFAHVENQYDTTLIITGHDITINASVVGETAGGIIGSVNGNVELCLTGFTLPDYTSGAANSTSTAVGGLIGLIDGQKKNTAEDSENSGETAGSETIDNSKGTFTLTSGTDIIYTHRAKTFITTNKCNYSGGLFGCIQNADVSINAPLYYVGGNVFHDIRGRDAGTFAGHIKNSKITLNAPFTSRDALIYRLSYTSEVDWQKNGVGMFAGVIENSEICSGTGNQLTENAPAIIIKNQNLASGTCNITNSESQASDKASYNVGGLIGYAFNSDLKFTKNNPCKIDAVTTTYTRGNVSGIVGLVETDGKNSRIENIQVCDTRLIGWEGNTGGLAGYVKMSNGEVLISNCSYNGDMKFAVRDNNAFMSTGVAKAETVNNSTGKLVLENIECKSMLADEGWGYRLNAYGGAIGLADADFEIKGTKNVFDHTSESLLSTNGGCGTDYYGGLIGIINNSSGTIRKGTVSNVLVGRCNFPIVMSAYGGLFGKVAEKTAISISGTIGADGITEINGTTASIQNAFFQMSSEADLYLGTIAGEADNALIYFEPGYTFHESSAYESDEIGNYGGVIRNGYWDKVDDNNTRELLIQDYQVKGMLSNDIDSVGDILRFAIAMNTEGVFLPEENQSPECSLNNIEAIRKATYTLYQAEYNLEETGLICLGRNDDEGISNFSFQGSFIGSNVDNPSTIVYKIKSHNQKNIGLFPYVEARETGIIFQNLNLKYTLEYAQRKAKWSANQNNDINRSPKTEHAGGLAAVAKGDITVDNVSYTGIIKVVNNYETNWSTNEYIDKQDNDCQGGIFGTYIGVSGKTLQINKLTTNMDFLYKDFTHILGGVIGYVNLDGITDNAEKCNIYIGKTDGPITLSGNIEINAIKDKPVREGALIALIGNKEKEGKDYVPKCNLTVNNLNVNNVIINQQSDKLFHSEMGGFLGYYWKDVEVSLSNVEVGSTGDAKLQSVRAPFGGLVHTVCGKMLISKLNIGSKTHISTANQSGIDQCGLLVRDGRYLYLNIKDYQVADGVHLELYRGSYFDELVGFTKGGDDSYHGGIVSIESGSDTYYLGRNSTEYQSYQNGHVVNESAKAINKTNPNTRYYYDLSKMTLPDDFSTLDSPDDVLAWHVLHYANESIRKCIVPGYVALPESYRIKNRIDMKGYSIYPTPVRDESYTSEGGSIVFRAQEVIAGENTMTATNNQQKYPEDSNFQHYQMQAGLFSNVSGITIDGLTIGGTYSKEEKIAGALVAGSIYGIETGTDTNGKTLYESKENKFSNIILDNLWCVSKDALNYDAPLGLMIADISSGANVIFDNISMTNYQDGDVQQKKAASALIGNVGGETATYISLNFKNMDIADAADGKSKAELKSSKMDEALAKASFIYAYDYVENCNAIYTFTYLDYLNGRCNNLDSNKVTLGEELGTNEKTPGYAKEEYFDKDLPVGKLEDDSGVAEIPFACTNYLPYVCNGKKILVNPKVGHLTVGCGTYEDPYVISTTRQMITLYRYLYDEEKFQEILTSGKWSVNPIGDDSKLCHKSTDTSNGHGSAILYKEEGFPNQQDLSHAYYQIAGDIDLSEYPEFVGFGRTECPFVGVFVGKSTENVCPTVIMSKLTSDMPNYGFIQVSKGCVVKDIIIQFDQPVKINNTITVINASGKEETKEEGGVGAGVIATVLGGESIIDNVTVTGLVEESKAPVQCFSPGNTKAMIGGYVGVVNAGGVILRNMEEDSLSNFSVNLLSNTSLDQYLYTCGIIGRVYDGYVVYDGGTDNTKALFKDLGIYANTYMNQNEESQQNGGSRSYDIINGEYLQNNQGTIEWSNNAYTISNAAQLQVISMALNSGMLNYDNSESMWIGYNKLSKQRSGNYDYVGAVSEAVHGSVGARENVIKYDNLTGASDMAYHSYLSQYFNWDESTIIELDDSTVPFDGTNGKAVLNLYNEIQTYNLTGTTYDMSGFGNAFRGLGARYFTNESSESYNVFHGNFIGPANSAAEIKMNMVVDGIQDVTDAALFNNIKRPSENPQNIKIANITLSGTILNNSDTGETFSTEAGTNNAAGFVSTLENMNVTFENVKLNQLKVQSKNYAAGMVAHCQSDSLTFNRCGITSSAASKQSNDNMFFGMSDTGGFVGYAEANIIIDGISVLDHMDVESKATKSSGAGDGKNAGGLIGRAEDSFTIDGNGSESSETTPPLIGTDIIVRSDGELVQIGGLVGSANISDKTYTFSDITLNNLTVENIYQGSYSSPGGESGDNNKGENVIGIAGIVGSAAGTTKMTNITVGSSTDDISAVVIRNTNEKIPFHNYFGCAGFIGRGISKSTLNVRNCKVLGCRRESGQYTTLICGGSNSGGIIGNSRTVNEGKDIEINGVLIKGGRFVGGFSGYHESGNVCNLTDISVKNVKIALMGFVPTGNNQDYGDVGGIIGRSVGTISLTDAIVDSLEIDSDYCNNAGGFVGKEPRGDGNYFEIKGTNNAVSNSMIGGIKVGGVVGTLGTCVKIKEYNNISISGNKLIASQERRVEIDSSKSYYNSYDGTKNYNSYAAAGGFAGELGTNTSGTDTNPDCIYAEKIKIEDNLIASYDGVSNATAKLGGIIGNNYSESYFYDVELTDNYIGMMKQEELRPANSEGEVDCDARKIFLWNTLIVGEQGNGLRDYLYYVTDVDNDKTCEIYKNKIGTTEVSSDKFYQYSYCHGALVGNVVSGYGLSKFINVHVDYTNSSYRPVADVGSKPGTGLESNSDMYDAYRKLCAIVYDGEMTNNLTKTIAQKFGFTESVGNFDVSTPYVFGNIEDIWNTYTTGDKRNSYRLEENYQNGRAIDKDEDVDHFENLSTQKIYENTYKDAEGYKSPFTIGDNAIPMVVYNSADFGSLDQVIQTYINILTNNSGGLNSYVNANKKSGYRVIEAETYKMELTGGQLSLDPNAKDKSVVVNKRTDDASKFEFSIVDGDELTSEGDGTFSLIRITYGWCNNYSTLTSKWTLYIPVYVEKRLRIHSNMKMLEGIQHDISKIKSNGQNVLKEASDPSAMILPRGNSYSIYAEYVYEEDALDKFSSVKIPKSFCMKTDSATTFAKGSKITMIALDEKSKPYYYTVTEDNEKQIDFTSFKDAEGIFYVLKDIKNGAIQTDYSDSCGITYEKVVVERYVLLVDTSDTGYRNNSYYEMHILPDNLWDRTNPQYDSALSSRIDYIEHCYEYVNEINGVTCKINTQKVNDNEHENTYLEPASKISKGGSVNVHLQYDIEAEDMYWRSNRGQRTYLDVGFYLAIQEQDEYKKVPLPDNTVILFGSGDDTVSVAAAKGQTNAYYYQTRSNVSEKEEYICINELKANLSEQIDMSFDFSNADMSGLEQYSNNQFYVVAELVVTTDKELPAAGEIKDSYSMSVGAETKTDIGFALEVDELQNLGMNKYASEDSDSGVVPYSASIAFPEKAVTGLESKYYTIVYQIEEKTLQNSGKTEYTTYTGDNVSLYLGTFDTKENAKAAAKETTSVNSGKGVVAVSYKFSTDNITDGADLVDGQTPSSSENVINRVVKTHCTLVANCESLNMTNYRIKAYLIVSDGLPDISTDVNNHINSTGIALDSCLKGQLLRTGNWSTITGLDTNADLKNDFFVFTVAKIKTSMQ